MLFKDDAESEPEAAEEVESEEEFKWWRWRKCKHTKHRSIDDSEAVSGPSLSNSGQGTSTNDKRKDLWIDLTSDKESNEQAPKRPTANNRNIQNKLLIDLTHIDDNGTSSPGINVDPPPAPRINLNVMAAPRINLDFLGSPRSSINSPASSNNNSETSIRNRVDLRIQNILANAINNRRLTEAQAALPVAPRNTGSSEGMNIGMSPQELENMKRLVDQVINEKDNDLQKIDLEIKKLTVENTDETDRVTEMPEASSSQETGSVEQNTASPDMLYAQAGQIISDTSHPPDDLDRTESGNSITKMAMIHLEDAELPSADLFMFWVCVAGKLQDAIKELAPDVAHKLKKQTVERVLRDMLAHIRQKSTNDRQAKTRFDLEVEKLIKGIESPNGQLSDVDINNENEIKPSISNESGEHGGFFTPPETINSESNISSHRPDVEDKHANDQNAEDLGQMFTMRHAVTYLVNLTTHNKTCRADQKSNPRLIGLSVEDAVIIRKAIDLVLISCPLPRYTAKEHVCSVREQTEERLCETLYNYTLQGGQEEVVEAVEESEDVRVVEEELEMAAESIANVDVDVDADADADADAKLDVIEERQNYRKRILDLETQLDDLTDQLTDKSSFCEILRLNLHETIIQLVEERAAVAMLRCRSSRLLDRIRSLPDSGMYLDDLDLSHPPSDDGSEVHYDLVEFESSPTYTTAVPLKRQTLFGFGSYREAQRIILTGIVLVIGKSLINFGLNYV